MAAVPLRYTRGSLSILDQRLLPQEIVFEDVNNVEETWGVINTMKVRGAPLIGIIAVLGLSVDLWNQRTDLNSIQQVVEFVATQANYLKSSRPTAVNLFNEMDNLMSLVNSILSISPEISVNDLVDRIVSHSESVFEADVLINRQIGEHGAKYICSEITNHKLAKVMTHCNTGSLATGGFGTALGVVRAIHAKGQLERIFATETRPYNQGSRLTAYEIVTDGLPGTLITDSMAAALIAEKGVDCIVVGADRIAANGDTANKIGTFQLAIIAKHFGIPFFIAAPTSTIDLSITSGSEIVIEQRSRDELIKIKGVLIAPTEIDVWNPSFDVTPSELINGIITEKGIIFRNPETLAFDVAGFMNLGGNSIETYDFSNYRILNEQIIPHYLLSCQKAVDVLGSRTPSDFKVKEVGDGNLNLVFIIHGPSGSVVVKQALPYVRCVGESWPLTLERATFESEALFAQYNLCPTNVPEVYKFDTQLAVIVMRYIEPPHIILRKGLIAAVRYSTLGEDISNFLANTLFFTSFLALPGPEFRKKVSYWSRNHSLCALTEQVIFSEPYFNASNNRWTSPQLDDMVTRFQSDFELKSAISILKQKFVGSTQALIHGDLHTGSVMVKEGSTLVIDPEFAFYGPIGFDIGAILANLLLAYFSQPGHSNNEEYNEWILSQVKIVWEQFCFKFANIWSQFANKENQKVIGAVWSTELFPDQNNFAEVQCNFMQQIFKDSIGFAGAKMIRRIFGIAHVEDFESIQDSDLRAKCERNALIVAREIMIHSDLFRSIDDVIQLVKSDLTF